MSGPGLGPEETLGSPGVGPAPVLAAAGGAPAATTAAMSPAHTSGAVRARVSLCAVKGIGASAKNELQRSISRERRHSLLRPDRIGPTQEFCLLLLVRDVLGLDAGVGRVIDGPRGLVADVHGRLLGCHVA